MSHEQHAIEPVFDKSSKILILGSFPSVKSRESRFFYGHPQNRFWKILAGLLSEPVPTNIEEKKALLLTRRIAIWDVIKSCDIVGSSDSTIRNVIPNDLNQLLLYSQISQIFTNGNVSHKLYKIYCMEKTGKDAIKLPSSSPANAAFSLERLLKEWEIIKHFL